MKAILTIVALVASLQAAAFWGWNDNRSSGYGYSNGYADTVGNADAAADFTFDFDMTARMHWEGQGYGNGYGRGVGDGYGYGYNSYIPYYGAPYGYLPPPMPVVAEEPVE